MGVAQVKKGRVTVALLGGATAVTAAERSHFFLGIFQFLGQLGDLLEIPPRGICLIPLQGPLERTPQRIT